MKFLKILVLLVLVILLSNVTTKSRAKFGKNKKKRDENSSNKEILMMKYHRRCLITEFDKLHEKKSNAVLKKAVEDLENLNVEETMNKGENLSQKEKDNSIVSSISKTFKILEPLKTTLKKKVFETVSEIMNRCYTEALNAKNQRRKK